ncbi:7075_t:CDS:2 [Funneliformis geosporum]|nr:7075_t:CDS:2 [Funneliformis geosporum]
MSNESSIFTIINKLPFTIEEKTDLRIFFIDYDPTRVENVLSTIISDEEKTELLRKYLKSKNEHQDEDANRFWNALKDQNVERGEFLKLPEGIHFLGDKDEISTLYIRNCYRNLAKIAFNKKTKKRLRISGNPGVGKTLFGYYLLYLLSQKNIVTIYDHHASKTVIIFDKNNVFRTSSIKVIESYQKNSDAWYIIDGKIPVKANARTVLLCSPRKDLYREFDKFGRNTIRIMPVWNRKEIDYCRNKIFYNVERETVENLFMRWGGVPRFVLEQTDESCLQDQLDKAIKKCNMDIFNYIGDSTDTDEMSHKLVHIYTNLPFVKDENEMDLDTNSSDIMLDRDGDEPYTKEIIRFASDYVKREVTEKLEDQIRNRLRIETNLSLKAGISNSLLGMSFEQIAHWMLREGGIFKTHSLELNGVKEDLLIDRQGEIFEFFESDISVIKDEKYYKPVEQNFPSIDAIIAPNKLFQMTIAKIHPIKMNGLKMLQDKLGGDNASENIKFYFVVPEHLYDNYGKQNFHTSDDTLAKDIPLWIQFRVNQYALKIVV